MDRIENNMLRERSYEFIGEENRFDGAGWIDKDGKFVREEDAFDYALDHYTEASLPPGFHKIQWTQEFRDLVVEWFYSGGEWKREN